MNKLACIFLCLACICLLPALDLRLKPGDSSARIIRSNPSGLELRINLSAVSADSDGKIGLPDDLNSFVIPGNASQLVFHLALPSTGDFRMNFSEHSTRSGLPAPEGYIPPSETVSVGEPYWLREVRGVDIVCSPFNADKGRLLVADSISICITMQGATDSETSSLNPYWLDIYRQHFINFSFRYEDLAEYGSMAVICPPYDPETQAGRFQQLIQPWVDWKNQQGIRTTVYPIAQAGCTFEEIQTTIRSIYQSDPQLTFVQLVGDYTQVPCKVTTLYGNTGGMDAYYSLIVGDDFYPDIFVGRLSAETAAELYTQVARSVDYEKGLSSGAWLSRAAGVCSSNPPIPGDDDEHNWEHLDNIRDLLLAYGYTSVDRVYANEGANTQDLIDCLNDGKSLVNYCGEGYPDHWVEPEFGIEDVASLTNTDMLPFVHVVSCWTGQFYNGTCLAEALMRARDATSSQARGAIAVYASAPEQGVVPPMEAQDHAMGLLTTESKHTLGGICYNGACSMIDAYGEYGAYNFLAWNLFGDASLQLRTQPTMAINANLPLEIEENASNLDIDTGSPSILVSLLKNDQYVGSAFSGDDGIAHLNIQPAPISGENYLLTLSGFNRLPIQKSLHCYASGAHPVLEMELLPSEQVLEPEVEIIKTLRITNHGNIAAYAVDLTLVSDNYQILVPMQDFVHWTRIGPGELMETQLSFRVPSGTSDLSVVSYRINLSPGYGSSHYDEVVHAPTIVLDRVYRTPQPNWFCPGDSLSLVYKLRNTGSARLRNMRGELSSQDNLLVTIPDDRHLFLEPGAADSLVFGIQVPSSCSVYESVNSELTLQADNAMRSFDHSWLVTEPQKTVESFETQELQTFPWEYVSDQWQFSSLCADGAISLESQTTSAETAWLNISFYCLYQSEVSFSYFIEGESDCQDTWALWVDGIPAQALNVNNRWEYKRINLAEGYHTLRWVGTRGSSRDSFASVIRLDMVQFTYGTLFSNARLVSDTNQADITLAPGEIRSIPIQLSSADGKDIDYCAVLRRADSPSRSDEGVRLLCNKSSFNPGSEQLFMLSLYNSDPAQRVCEVSIDLPEAVIASQVSSFTMPGELPLAFTGSVGSLSSLQWYRETGSEADSLRCAVRLVVDANLSSMVMPYEVHSVDSNGEQHSYEGTMELTEGGEMSESVVLLSDHGVVRDRETSTLTLRANQNLLQGEEATYYLDLFYNGNNMLTIPINIAYDNDPSGFYDTPHLQVYPNPCRAATTVAYGISTEGRALLEIYNIRGQKVRTLVDSPLAKGFYRSVWDASDDRGDRVSSGIYFCKLQASGTKVVSRFIVLH